MASHQQAPRTAMWEGGWPQTLDEFERLVGAFQDRLVRYAFRRLGSLHEAEEVAQEVFLRAYDSRTKRTKVTCVTAYLYRMASNLCTTLLRRRKRWSVVIHGSEFSEIPTNQPDSWETAAASEELRRVESLLRHLPRRQAKVVRLRVLDELRLREIADVIGCPLGTVKSRLRYGLEKLRGIVLQQREGL